jgi:hypothetical protein
MNHRDRRDYHDPGREELPDDAIEWMDQLRRTFSDLLLAAIGIPQYRSKLAGVQPDAPRNGTIRELATRAVDELLMGTVATMQFDPEDAQNDKVLAAVHFGNAFISTACGSPQLWSECLTALIRRSVVVWARLAEAPGFGEVFDQMDLVGDARIFLVAITTEPVDEPRLPLSERSRLAVHRVTAWFNSHGDLWATLAAAVSVTALLVSAGTTLVDADMDPELFVQELSVGADALLHTS